MNNDIEWRLIEGFEDYEVSEKGHVRRVVQSNKKNIGVGFQLKHEINKDGHARVCLYKEKKTHRIFVHRLVCRAWHGEAPASKPFACHKNDIKNDNSKENLYWGCRKENGRDSVKNGKSVRGERINTAILSETQVLKIRISAANGVTNIDLAKIYNVSDHAISQIVRGKNWKHVGGPIISFSRRGRRYAHA